MSNATATATAIDRVILEVPDPAAARAFYAAAFDLTDQLELRSAGEPSAGFRGFTIGLTVSQPSGVDSFVASAVGAGATVIKPAQRSFWGYGGVVRTPDGAIVKVACSAKKSKGPVTRELESLTLLLGVADVKATKRFYEERGLVVDKSFGGKYAQFKAAGGPITLALYGRDALAKDAGLDDASGSGSHRLAISSSAGAFTDPDGFAWEAGA